ncbi:MAG TPA: hypothetical protein VFK02_34905 [Kofleriaceae bacterium]|nr:hypothetical protein [Kofleriaceae bacterium]
MPAGEPTTFDDDVRQPGLRAIAELCGKRPALKRDAGRAFKKIAEREADIPVDHFPPYWIHCLDDLMERYNEICAYSCFRIHRVTGARSVDHLVAKSDHWRRIYEWSNYRLCCSRLNARKGAIRTVLDPFHIEPGWFQLELVGFKVHPDRGLPAKRQAKIQRTIDVLGLNDFRHDREQDAENYWSKDVSLRILRKESPFVAEDLKRQRRLNPGDRWEVAASAAGRRPSTSRPAEPRR